MSEQSIEFVKTAVLQKVFGPIAEDVEGFAVIPEELIGSGDTVAAVVPVPAAV